MKDRTTLQLPRPLLSRLRGFGLKGHTYADILENMMREIRYQEFMERVYAADAETNHYMPLDKL